MLSEIRPYDLFGGERLGELDFALMTNDQLVDWIGAYVCGYDALPLCRWLERLKPGLVEMFLKKWPDIPASKQTGICRP